MSKAFNLPLNSVSFGQVSTLLLRELFLKQKDIYLFPINGGLDFSSQSELDENIKNWVLEKSNSFLETYKRDIPIFKLWHLNGSLESYGTNQYLFSFYELDSPTVAEINIVQNNKKVFFSSQETCDLFKEFGCKNIKYIPLAFDKYNFYKKDKTYLPDRITFNLTGKLEKRKHHLKIIKSWLKRYGNNPKYFLNCAIYNPFIKNDIQEDMLRTVIDKQYFNINFLSFMEQNSTYNDYLNSGNIIIGMSGGEGWGLPEFHSVGLGKHSIILNCNGYKGWASEKNSTLVEPTSKIEAYDNLFFKKGQKFNQGNIYDFEEDAFISACELAENKFISSPINKEGLLLQEQFSSEKFARNIFDSID